MSGQGSKAFVITAALVCAVLFGGCEELRRAGATSQAPPTAQPAPQVVSPAETGPLVSQDLSSTPETESGLTQPEIYRGRGLPIAVQSAQGVSTVGSGEITANFVNAEIREVVGTILGEALGLTYIVDPRVQGTITLRTARPLPRAVALGVLEDVLAMNGAALVKEGEVYKIVPLSESVSAPAILRQGAAPAQMDRGYSLYVFPLRYASASSLMEVIKPLAPPGRTLRVDAERNLFILAATASEADDFADLLALFDVDWMSDKSFGLFPLKHADAEKVAEELRQIFAQPQEAKQAGIIEFLPIERLNAVLAVTTQDAYLDDAQAWVQRLDRGIETDKRQLYVYFVQNGRATELAEVVGEALSAQVSRTEEAAVPSPRVAPGLVPSELTSPASTPATDTQQGSTAVEAPSSDIFNMDETLPGTRPAPSYTSPPAPDLGISGASEAPQSNFRIVADNRNNALLVYATSEEYELVSAALKKLDIVPLQVFIEATIAEVTLNDTLKYGVEWFFDLGNSNITFSTAEPRTNNPRPSNLVFSQFPGFSYLFATSDARVVLNALTQITDVKVISSPTLLVLDNEPARLQVGDQVPISVRSSTSVTDPEAPVVNEIEYRDTGVILDIIPRVNSNGLVVLDIVQEVSDVVAATNTNVTTTETISPTIAQRRILSTVAVNSGQTVALGGLIRDSHTDAVSGVPLLSDIPILGNLFKTTSDLARRTELLVLLTPRVVRDSNDARTITDELRRRLRAIEKLPPLIQ